MIKYVIVSGKTPCKSARHATGAFARSQQVLQIHQLGVERALVEGVMAAGETVAQFLIEPLCGDVFHVGVQTHDALAGAEGEARGIGGTQSVCMTMTSSSPAGYSQGISQYSAA